MRPTLLLLCLFLLCSCGPSSEERRRYADMTVSGNQTCKNLLDTLTHRRDPHRMQRWSECRTERLMPMDLWQFPSKKDEIRAHYTAKEEESARVDAANVDSERATEQYLAGRMSREEARVKYEVFSQELEALYKKWDERKAEIGLPTGLCFDTPDGGRQCY